MQESKAHAAEGASEAGVGPTEQRSLTTNAPWEMFPADSESSSGSEHAASNLDAETHARLLDAVESCLAEDRYNLFIMAPEPDESYPLATGGTADFHLVQCNEEI